MGLAGSGTAPSPRSLRCCPRASSEAARQAPGGRARTEAAGEGPVRRSFATGLRRGAPSSGSLWRSCPLRVAVLRLLTTGSWPPATAGSRLSPPVPGHPEGGAGSQLLQRRVPAASLGTSRRAHCVPTAENFPRGNHEAPEVEVQQLQVTKNGSSLRVFNAPSSSADSARLESTGNAGGTAPQVHPRPHWRPLRTRSAGAGSRL